MNLSTQELGALAELRFQTRCVERGIECFSPIIGANPTVDFVIRLSGRYVSVQVKKARMNDNGGSTTPRVIANTKDKRYDRYRTTDSPRADYYAFVCFELNSIWLIPSSAIPVITWSCRSDRLDEISTYLF